MRDDGSQKPGSGSGNGQKWADLSDSKDKNWWAWRLVTYGSEVADTYSAVRNHASLEFKIRMSQPDGEGGKAVSARSVCPIIWPVLQWPFPAKLQTHPPKLN